MILLPIQTRLLTKGDSLAKEIPDVRSGDIVVVSSKVIATIEGAVIDLGTIKASNEAKEWSMKTGSRSPEFIEAVLEETKRLNGRVVGSCPGALLTEVKPTGLPRGTILTANAGLDESNIEKGYAVGWPHGPVLSALNLKKELGARMKTQEKQGAQVKQENKKSLVSPFSLESPESSIAVIITDSCCRPRRWGVTAFALVTAGIDPLIPQKGQKDLFGKELRITTEAVADQLATAANMLMGNAGQATPVVIIRDHGVAFSDFAGWVPGIEPEEDLFRGIL